MGIDGVPIEELPETIRLACVRLRNGLLDLLGDDLVALWAYGAAVFPDRPRRLGDVDTHAVLADTADLRSAGPIDELHTAIAGDIGIEWDGWYILEPDARSTRPPNHVFRPHLTDDAWPLHRAHWLAGRYVALHGRGPSELVPTPTWPEIEVGLDGALEYNEEILEEGKQDDPRYAAFAVWNACRVLYSIATHDPAVSKRTAAHWGLEHMPSSWHPALHAAGRVYDDEADDDDAEVLRTAMPRIVHESRERFESGR
jgi:hypothetical protein